uniref:Uncharacterized protein n=1 Tax=Vespula pensylvanica TaxID=30213 RepID=A0A834PE64_VESPE|nr:hypothetical protein H0235_000554 [Vespula pensylvanica]
MQQPPRGGTWVGSTCSILKSKSKLCNASTTGRIAAYFKAFPKSFQSNSNPIEFNIASYIFRRFSNK